MKSVIKHSYITLKDWALSTVVTFLLCELFCILMFHEFRIEGSHWNERVIDLVYCGLFSFTSITVSTILSRQPYFSCFTYISQLSLFFLILLLNIVLSFFFEKVYCRILLDSETIDFWQSTYLFCLVATLVTSIRTTYCYCKLLVNKTQETHLLQKQVLRQQLDPHFVFNSLNSLAELTHSNPSEAENYVVRFSKVYRYILSHLDKGAVPIAESVEFIRNYVDLQQIRVPGKIDLRIHDALMNRTGYLPPMALQLLVENAIKHNTPTDGECLIIYIACVDDKVIVSNTIKQSTYDIESFGIGWVNLRALYAMDNMPIPIATIQNGCYEVRLPIIESQE